MTLCDELITQSLAKVAGDWSCTPLDDGWLLVTTSHQYSDGDHVELLVRRRDRTIEVSDGGEALSRLDLAGVNVDQGRARDMWRRLLRAHEVEVHQEQISILGPADQAGQLVANMANAVANIDGIRLLAPPARNAKFSERLVTFFQAEFEHVEVGPQMTGRSGGQYRATAAVGDPGIAVVVQAVSGANTQTRQRAIEHAFTMFSDINGALPVSRKLIVLSDLDWKSEHTRLLANVSYIGSWLHRDRLVGFINSPQAPKSHILMPVQDQIISEHG